MNLVTRSGCSPHQYYPVVEARLKKPFSINIELLSDDGRLHI